MLPWTVLDSTTVPNDDAELRLYRRGSEFSIRVGGHELMNSRVHGSEETFASAACARLHGRDRARILIGGLGMGYTLAAVLANAGDRAEVVVAELVPAVVEWNRTHMRELNGAALDDSRVTVVERDVVEVIRAARGAYDAILLDVDNGPAALTAKANHRLYSIRGLHAIAGALRKGGVLAVWSAGPEPSFTRRLQRAGFAAEELPVRGRGSAGGSRFLIWLASRA